MVGLALWLVSSIFVLTVGMAIFMIICKIMGGLFGLLEKAIEAVLR